MRNFTDKDLEKAQRQATSYKEFKAELKSLGNRVPRSNGKFPMNMKGWGRKLRYEISNDPHYGEPVTGHDIRQMRYYERLEDLGCKYPSIHMG